MEELERQREALEEDADRKLRQVMREMDAQQRCALQVCVCVCVCVCARARMYHTTHTHTQCARARSLSLSRAGTEGVAGARSREIYGLCQG